jgi:tripartite-type tricarboxylate transporter receptor subunit TctC
LLARLPTLPALLVGVLFGGVLAASTLASAPAAAADAWPTRPVTLVCPFVAGISTDLLTRAIASELSSKLGQQFVVENRSGATGNIGTASVAKAAPDGYTLLLATLGPLVTNKFMYRNVGYDSDKAFAPIALVSSSALTIAASPKLPVNNLQELIAYAKARPGELNAGTIGAGSQSHITLVLLNKLAGMSIAHVPYRQGMQAIPDLLSGDLQIGFNYVPTFVPAMRSGTIRSIAVTSLERFKDLPDVPTVHEQGFPGFEATGWNALVAPAGTPREIVDKVNGIVNAWLASDAGRTQIDKIGMTALGGTPEALRTFLESESAKWGPIIKEAGISLQ